MSVLRPNVVSEATGLTITHNEKQIVDINNIDSPTIHELAIESVNEDLGIHAVKNPSYSVLVEKKEADITQLYLLNK